MYTCGPTVYDYAHIGNFRTFTFVDILRRWLRARGFKLDHVMNITDVDDKIIRNAAAQHKIARRIHRDLHAGFLRRLRHPAPANGPSAWTPATEHIDEMVDAIERLADGGYTYASDGSVYFRISTFPGYGKLSHNDFSGILRRRARRRGRIRKGRRARFRAVESAQRRRDSPGRRRSARAAPAGTSNAP